MLGTAETVPALTALSAQAVIVTKGGAKVAPVEELYKELKEGGVITELRIPALPASTRSGYRKFAVRERFDYATVAAAVVMTIEEKTCTGIKIGLGGVSLRTRRAKAAEDVLKGRPVTDALIEKAAQAAAESASLGSDIMFPAEYKKKVLKTMVERAIGEACAGVAG
jgi:CO/xanthine dehydrogenase FAD-binding subunit